MRRSPGAVGPERRPSWDNPSPLPASSPTSPTTPRLPELTLRAVLLGSFLGLIFGASSVYLALRVGLTVSASVPIAVISITLFRALSQVLPRGRASILENSVVQTAGSAGESIAAGVAFTLPGPGPAGLRAGLAQDADALALRRDPRRPDDDPAAALPDRQGARRPHVPRGDGLRRGADRGGGAGRPGGARLQGPLRGSALQAGHRRSPSCGTPSPRSTSRASRPRRWPATSLPSCWASATSSATARRPSWSAEGLLSWLVLIPAIALFGEGRATALYPATTLISDMSPDELWSRYIRYIGAGAVAAGRDHQPGQGAADHPRLLPRLVPGLAAHRARGSGDTRPRTERDIPISVVLVGCARPGALHDLPAAAPGGARPRRQPALGGHDHRLRVLLLGGVVAHHGRAGVLEQPRERHGHRHPHGHVPHLHRPGLDGPRVHGRGAFDRHRRLHRLEQRRHHQPGPEDELPRRRARRGGSRWPSSSG